MNKTVENVERALARIKAVIGVDQDGSYTVDNYNVRQLCNSIEALLKERARLREALEKIVKEWTIPWKDSESVHVEHWAKIAILALSPEEAGR